MFRGNAPSAMALQLPPSSTTPAAVGQQIPVLSAQQQHRPSPYMRRVRLPRLDFSLSSGRHIHAPWSTMDDDLPSPEEICAKLELIQLKNGQNQRNARTNNGVREPTGESLVDVNMNMRKVAEMGTDAGADMKGTRPSQLESAREYSMDSQMGGRLAANANAVKSDMPMKAAKASTAVGERKGMMKSGRINKTKRVNNTDRAQLTNKGK